MYLNYNLYQLTKGAAVGSTEEGQVNTTATVLRGGGRGKRLVRIRQFHTHHRVNQAKVHHLILRRRQWIDCQRLLLKIGNVVIRGHINKQTNCVAHTM